ncbi:MAG: signal peptidase I [Lachnospiraceae bacterium]|nr:signal peptidase I [Lachnospiraceae bacterium]
MELKDKITGVIRELIIYALIIVVCIYVIPQYVIQRTIVDGESMENTLMSGDNLLVEKLSYRVSDPERFDIIVFYPQGNHGSKSEYYVKRVIGLPGETVQIIGEDIYIDGKILDENYGKDPIMDAGIAIDPITLADDEYFVMGDNRTISKDSRSSDVGPVAKSKIAGKVILRMWPFDEFGTLD